MLARPRGPASALGQAALGLALAGRGEHEAATVALETALGGAPVPARAHLAFARAESLLAAGQAPLAARLFSQATLVPGLALAHRARFREGDALFAAGLADEASAALEAVLAAAPEDRAAAHARLVLGRAARAAGDDARATATLRALWLERPAAQEARDAEAILSAWRSSGGPVPPFEPREHLDRAERLVLDGWPEAALAELDRAAQAEPPSPPAGRSEVLRAMAVFALGRPADAAALAQPLAEAADASVRRGALFVLARAAARAGRFEEATALYARLAPIRAEVPGLPAWRQRDLEDEATFLASWLWYDAGDLTRAATALEGFARARPGSRRAADATWFAAWSRYRLGQAGEAARLLARLSPGPLADASAYWRARLTASPARRRALLEQALALGGDGWYGVLARARLAELGVHPKPPAAAPARPIPEINNSASAARLSVAVELLGLGLREQALDELRDLSRGPQARAAAPLVAQLAAFAGDPELPFVLARDQLAPTRRAQRWGHPEPFGGDVVPAARAAGLDPSLVYAVMRRESRFEVRARSGADARGLLQLRPATAARVAAVLGLPGEAGARLDDPRVNLPLGVHYLGLLVSRFQAPAVALAAYNAGPAVAAGWARDRAGQPLDVWVESIPYRETREYVKIVAAGWDVYRRLAGDGPAPLDPGAKIPAPAAGAAF
ncbi:MAG: lytic transglycosylase domain-containing protein [Anaeromyxobacteraceae bacterium]